MVEGGYLQIVVGTVFALLYLLLHNSCRPFEDSGLNVVKSISVGQIFCILYLGFISYAEFVDISDWRFNALTVAVVFANIPLELFIVYILPRFTMNTRDVGLTLKLTTQNEL